jgi:SAM-dependent methyltransferase
MASWRHIRTATMTDTLNGRSPITDGAATWNQRYAGAGYLFGREPNAYLRAQAAHLPPGGRVLCIADGEGRNSVWLARQGMAVSAFDVSDVAVAKAHKLAEEAGVTVDFQVSDCESWPWAAAGFDALVGIFFQFADPSERARLFANMRTALKPGGVLIIQGYTPKQLDYRTGGPGQLSHLYTADLLREAFASMDIVELVEYEAELQEGERHIGRSALVGLVARKV